MQHDCFITHMSYRQLASRENLSVQVLQSESLPRTASSLQGLPPKRYRPAVDLGYAMIGSQTRWQPERLPSQS